MKRALPSYLGLSSQFWIGFWTTPALVALLCGAYLILTFAWDTIGELSDTEYEFMMLNHADELELSELAEQSSEREEWRLKEWQSLYDDCLEGEPMACSELGYDPREEEE